MKEHDKYCLFEVLFEISGLAEASKAELYREYQTNRININNRTKPYVFSDIYKREHSPIIIYESSDYLPKFSNWSIYDKLQIQNNYVKYSYCELWNGKTIFLTGSLLIGSIYSILIMIDRVLKTQIRKSNMIAKLTIVGNEKMTLKMQKRIMNIDSDFFEMYYLGEYKEHKIEYHFNSINDMEINKFINRILELFTSENPKSKTPFLSATLDETISFSKLLLTYENYLVIDNF